MLGHTPKTAPLGRYDANFRQNSKSGQSAERPCPRLGFLVCGPRTEVRSSRRGADAYRARSRARMSRAIGNSSPQL
jgi:hypothetical protein